MLSISCVQDEQVESSLSTEVNTKHLVFKCGIENGEWLLKTGEINITSIELIGKFSDLLKFCKCCLFCEHWNVIGKTGIQWETMHFLEYTLQLSDSDPVGVILQPCKIILIYRQQICSVIQRFRWLCSFSMEKASFCVFVHLFHQCFFGFFWVPAVEEGEPAMGTPVGGGQLRWRPAEVAAADQGRRGSGEPEPSGIPPSHRPGWAWAGVVAGDMGKRGCEPSGTP